MIDRPLNIAENIADSAAGTAYDWIPQALRTIHRAQWYRSPQSLTGLPGATIELAGQRVLNFASND